METQIEIEGNLEEKLRASDPRDFIELAAFQKSARAIDPDPTHP